MRFTSRAFSCVIPIAFLLALAGCPYATIDSHPCPTGGTTLTYSNFGAPFMSRYCQGCHASIVSDRQGAPGEFIFDNVEQIRAHRDRIFARAAGTNDSMPPGPVDPPLAEREKLADWLACGAPE
jgi:hypothetical protein